MRKPRASPWEFRKTRTKPCKGETHAVKFSAQVLGQKATLLFRPYRACHCLTAQTQGDALGFHMAPRWGWDRGQVSAIGALVFL